MAAPLSGLVVLDLTRVLAGPFCTMMLADMGAEVIKVERPEGGDDSRSFPPFFEGESCYFMSINRGKKSVTLNLKHKKAKELLKAMAAKADVVVENFKPGVMAKLGFDYEVLHQLNPRLVYAASSGFGQTGPYSDRPAYDLIIQGMGGLMSITGPDAKTPTKVGSSIADILAGVFTCIGILSALYQRERTGRGQMVDVGMLDCMVAILENAFARFISSGQSPHPIGNRHPSIAPFSTFQTKDGSINICCGNDDLWARFCTLAQLPELITNPRFKDNKGRVSHWVELEPLMTKTLQKKTTTEWLGILQPGGVPCGPINSIAEVAMDPHLQFRDMFLEILHPMAGKLKMPGAPIKFSENPKPTFAPPPMLGQHNEEIIVKWLGQSKKDFETLKKDGVL